MIQKNKSSQFRSTYSPCDSSHEFRIKSQKEKKNEAQFQTNSMLKDELKKKSNRKGENNMTIVNLV